MGNKSKRGDSGMKLSKVAVLCLISFMVGTSICTSLNSVPVISLSLNSVPSASLNDGPLNSTPISKKEQRATTSSSTESHQLRSRKQERSKNLLQIGANDGVKGNVGVVKKILNDPASKAVLVEGSPQIFQLLTENVKANYDETQKRIVPVNAMVCEDGKQLNFYSPDIDKLKEKSTQQDLTIPHWVRYQIGSLEQENVIGGLTWWFNREVRGAFPNELSPGDFVRKETITCISLASIITQSSLTADEIGVLAVDVEGFDAPVVLESFKVPGLEPDIVVFEHKSTTTYFPQEFNTVMETLEARGYKFNCHRDLKAAGGWTCTGGQDVYAIKEASA